MSAAAAIIRKQKKYIALFSQHGAIDKDHALRPEDIGIRNNYIFQRLCDRGIFVPCGNGTYYLDQQAATFFIEARHKRAMVFLTILMILFFFYLLLGIR